MDKGIEGFWAREVSLSLIDSGDRCTCASGGRKSLTLHFMIKSNET